MFKSTKKDNKKNKKESEGPKEGASDDENCPLCQVPSEIIEQLKETKDI